MDLINIEIACDAIMKCYILPLVLTAKAIAFQKKTEHLRSLDMRI